MGGNIEVYLNIMKTHLHLHVVQHLENSVPRREGDYTRTASAVGVDYNLENRQNAVVRRPSGCQVANGP
jgi:hypothetical protein